MTDLKTTEDAMLIVSAENLKMLNERPLLAVPPDMRRPVFAAWSMFRHLTGMDTSAPIAFAVGIWISEHNISKEVIRKALCDLTKPDVMRAIRFASDLTATLAEMVQARVPHTVSSSGLPYTPYEMLIPKTRPTDDR